MFSRLEAIFKSNFIPIRESDPHPDLNRDAQNRNKKSRDHKTDDSETSTEFEEDKTTVSIIALQNFLNELTHAPDIKHDFFDRMNLRHDDQNKPSITLNPNDKTARAIQAYKHMAIESKTPPPPERVEGRIDRMLYHLNDDEKNMVATLITDLNTLQERGITKLSIRNDISFFMGIIDAITAEKQ